jgi:hypothetical protein
VSTFIFALAECPQCYCGEIRETLTFSYESFLPEILSYACSFDMYRWITGKIIIPKPKNISLDSIMYSNSFRKYSSEFCTFLLYEYTEMYYTATSSGKKVINYSRGSFIYEIIRIYKDRRICLNKNLYLVF